MWSERGVPGRGRVRTDLRWQRMRKMDEKLPGEFAFFFSFKLIFFLGVMTLYTNHVIETVHTADTVYMLMYDNAANK